MEMSEILFRILDVIQNPDHLASRHILTIQIVDKSGIQIPTVFLAFGTYVFEFLFKS